jgi:hypothetical protein
MTHRKALAAAIFIISSVDCSAQSTSPWIPVGSSNSPVIGIVGASYMSLNLTAVRVYQRSNWWTSIIENRRSALATVTVSGSLSGGGGTFMDKRMSAPISIRRNDSVIDLGFSQTLLRDIPVNFTALNVEVAIAKTAEDGADQLIKAANELSKTVPAMSAVSAASGTITATKQLADIVFNRKLAEEKLRSTSPLTAPAGTTIAPGFYAVLAGTNADEYAKYTSTPGAGATGLKWDGAKLTYEGTEVKLTYFVVEVAYKNSVFETATLPDSALSSNKNWARLYTSARQKIHQINTTDRTKFDEDLKPIAQIRSDAEQLLNEDAEYVHAEKVAIQSKIISSMTTSANLRWGELQSANVNRVVVSGQR